MLSQQYILSTHHPTLLTVCPRQYRLSMSSNLPSAADASHTRQLNISQDFMKPNREYRDQSLFPVSMCCIVKSSLGCFMAGQSAPPRVPILKKMPLLSFSYHYPLSIQLFHPSTLSSLNSPNFPQLIRIQDVDNTMISSLAMS